MSDRIVALVIAILVRMSRRPLERKGQGLVEYALILALIAILVIVALKFLQPNISSTLNKVANNL